jgi:hypothetical protein
MMISLIGRLELLNLAIEFTFTTILELSSRFSFRASSNPISIKIILNDEQNTIFFGDINS